MSEGYWAPVPEELLRSGLSPRAIQTYGMLLRYADTDRRAWPRQSTLAADLKCSLPTIERAVRELRETGWITMRRRGVIHGVEYLLNETGTSQDPVSDPSSVRGSDPSRMRVLYEPEPLEPEPGEKNTSCSSPPPRSAAVRGNAKSARDREDALDPAKALALWDAPAEHLARRAPSGHSPMGLALAWRARMQEARIAGALDTNVKALARMFRVMLQEGVTPAQIRAITDLYAAASGMRNPAVAPWRHFLYQRHLLLSRVRDAERDRRMQSDPDAYRYVPPTPEQEAEAARAHAAAFEDYLARTA